MIGTTKWKKVVVGLFVVASILSWNMGTSSEATINQEQMQGPVEFTSQISIPSPRVAPLTSPMSGDRFQKIALHQRSSFRNNTKDHPSFATLPKKEKLGMALLLLCLASGEERN